MEQIIRVGTRPSRLAIKQFEEVQQRLPHLRLEPVKIFTQGDKDQTTPFSEIEGSDFFTREIEKALLNGSIDAAVHSAKDLEENMPVPLTIAAITASVSPYECLVSREGKKLNELPQGARVGTSSQKRKDALMRYRTDLQICDIRGNIEERLRQLDEGRFDAIIMAHAALIRLGYENRISEIISAAIIPPHPLQGSLAVQVRTGDCEMKSLFSVLDI